MASSFVTHSRRATALVRVPPPTNHSLSPSITYRAARCLALLLSHNPSPLWIPSRVSITSLNSGVFAKRFLRLCVVGGMDSEMWLMPNTRPAPVSQSAGTSHSLPSFPDFGVFSYWRLSPSAIFVTPGMCQMSMMLWESTPSLHLA